MKRATIYISISLALSLGLLLVLLWLLGGEIGISMAAIRDVEPAEAAGAPGDVYCVTLVGGGPYAGCDQVFTSVQDAVDAASGGEVIKVAAGTYTGVQARPAPAGYEGPSVITQVVYISKTVSVFGGYTATDWTASYPITQPTTLDAQQQGRVLFITGDISPTVEGLRITGGDATGLGHPFLGAQGGGVHIGGAATTISDCIITGNTATDGYGGGLFLRRSDATFVGNTISHNAADTGGGLFLDGGDITFIGNTVISNTSDGSGGGVYFASGGVVAFSENTLSCNVAGGYGGGLNYSADKNSSATFSGNIIVSNIAGTGGGLRLEGPGGEEEYVTITLSANTIMSNTATGSGGGLYLELYGQDGNVTIIGNDISFNAANGTGYYGGGGGLCLLDAAKLVGNIISSNTSASGGGGVAVVASGTLLDNNVIADNVLTGGCGGGGHYEWATAQLRHNTIARNRGGDGSGLCVEGPVASITLINTILVSHTVGITVGAGSGASLEGTLWGSGAWANETDWGGDGTIISGTVNIWGDPDFVDPDSGDYHIGPDSVAIDAGVDAGVITDIDGDPRPAPAGTSPDLGADEVGHRRIYLPLVLRNY